MGYYHRNRRRRKRSGSNSRGWNGPSKYYSLKQLFGKAVDDIRNVFLGLDSESLDLLLLAYGDMHGASAERYARKTLPRWQSGATGLSGQTLERLIELVPPYLSPDQRFRLLQSILKHHEKPRGHCQEIRINIEDPTSGLEQLEVLLESMTYDDELAHLPEQVMSAATWLYDDDITATRAMLAQATRAENEILRSNAKREIDLLMKTIKSGQVKAANYRVDLPSGSIHIVAYKASSCYISNACFGPYAPETELLRAWRDDYLIKKVWGRCFIVWYYNNCKFFAALVNHSRIARLVLRSIVGGVVMLLALRFGESHER